MDLSLTELVHNVHWQKFLTYTVLGKLICNFTLWQSEFMWTLEPSWALLRPTPSLYNKTYTFQKSRENKIRNVCSSNCGSRSSHLEAESNQSRAMATHVWRPNPKQHQEEEGEAASILRGRLWSWLGRNLEGCFWCTPNFITCCIAIGGQPTEDHHVQYPMILGRCHNQKCGLTKRG